MKKARKKGLLPIGRVRRAHGLRGALEVCLYSKEYEGICSLDEIVLARGKDGGGGDREFEIRRVRKKREGRVILELNGITDRTSAEAFKGSELLCKTCDLPPLDEDEFYWFEIEGFEVVDCHGKRLGTVARCLETPGHDIIICEGEGGEFLVPVVSQILKEVRRGQRQIVIDPPPGLLEANAL